jgi:hypothetical protein
MQKTYTAAKAANLATVVSYGCKTFIKLPTGPQCYQHFMAVSYNLNNLTASKHVYIDQST